MPEANDITQFMSDVMDSKTADSFYYYEPWEPEEPEDQSNGFQTNFHLSTDRVRCANTANRVGKTQMDGIEIVCMMTGEVPYAMRVDRGVDTGIARIWEDEGEGSPGTMNRIRFGFVDPKTGAWTPPRNHPDMEQPASHTPDRPCGNIVGAGIFPVEKISRRKNDCVWVCTYKQVRDKRWIDMMTELIPDQFLDKRWAENGYSKRDCCFRLTNGNEIAFITYEMGWQRIQGANIWAIFYDEEPEDRRFWTEGDQRLIGGGTDGYMVLSFTPLHGLSWSYNDLYLPILNGRMECATIYHATQFDSPYITSESINYRINNNYKPWEIEARVHGKFSEMEGRPYYDWETLDGWVKKFASFYSKYRIIPNAATPELSGMIQFGAHIEPACAEDKDYWEFYEDKKTGAKYWITADTAEGDEQVDPGEDDMDRSVAYVWREPVNSENMQWPVLVAALRTAMLPMNFARELAYAGMFFDYCLIAPEVKGTTGGEVIAELRNYPFLFQMVVINDRTKKPTNKTGFDMNARTRRTVFDLIGDWINGHNEPSFIRHEALLQEAYQCIVGRKGRPDHPRRGTSDCLVAGGIGHYVYRYNRDQITDNSHWGSQINQTRDKKPFARYLNDSSRKTGLGTKNRPRNKGYSRI